MTHAFTPTGRHEVVIAGGGVAALEALIGLRTLAPDRVDVTLVCPNESFAYRAADVDEPFGRGGARQFALAPIAASLGAHLARDCVESVSTDGRRLSLRSGRVLAYDSLLLALGAKRYPAFDNGTTFDREPDPDVLAEMLTDIDARLAASVAIIVPPGVRWTLPAYQLALSIANFGRTPADRQIAVTIVTPEHAPLSEFGDEVSRAVASLLAAERIAFVSCEHPVVADERAVMAGAHWITVDRIISLPQLSGPRIAGIPCDTHGFIRVDEHARVEGVEGVYAAGDATALEIKQGGLAARQADAAVSHILHSLGLSQAAKPFEPELHAVLFSSLGPLRIHGVGSGVVEVDPGADPASRVASRWLGPYLEGSAPRAAPIHTN